MTKKYLTNDKKNRLSYLFGNLEGLVALAMLLSYTGIIMTNIILRVLGMQTLIWSLEIILGLFAWITWLATSFAVKHRSHLRFTLFRKDASQLINYLSYWLEYVLWIVIIGALFRFTITVLVDRLGSGRNIIGTPIPNVLLYLSVVVGSFLILVRATEQILRVRKRYKNGEDIRPDAAIEVRNGD
jgi:TRAP-type C4-dicarboxylate transport system permease small subunit